MSVLLTGEPRRQSVYRQGGRRGTAAARSAGSNPTTRATDLPATLTATLPPATATAAATATAKATPAIVGDGVPPNTGGTFPPYTGPVSGGRAAPAARPTRPVGRAIRSAGDYGAPHANVVALTFDDGPTPYYSPAIISYLEQTHTPATFFVLGQYAQAYP